MKNLKLKEFLVHPFSKNDRVLIFNSQKYLNQNEFNLLKDEIENFSKTWRSHEEEMKISFFLVDFIFLVVIIDESFTKLSGCGTDKFTNFLKQINIKYNIDFFNRRTFPILIEGVFEFKNLESIKELKEKKINNTYMFNTNIMYANEINEWLLPLNKI